MATLGTNTPTLADWLKIQDPDGKVAPVVRILAQDNGFLEDVVWKPANMGMGHRITIQSSLPSVYFRKLNSGTPTSKATTRQATEGVSMLEGRFHVDAKMADLQKDAKAYRAFQAASFLESMRQTMATTMVYGNAKVYEEQFTGLAPRYSAISGADNADQIIDAGGSGSDNTSIWLIGWGMNTVAGLFPEESTVGFKHEDLGKQDVQDANGNWFQAYKDLFQWDCGLAVEDWRFVVRVANIDVSDLAGGSAADLVDLMAQAIDRLPHMGESIKPQFLAHRTVVSKLRRQAMVKSQDVLTIEDGLNQFGKNIKQMSFLGIPIRSTDAILKTESRVV